jgi:hypothetical protein
MHHIRGQKLRVIVKLGCQVEALIAGPVAVARQPDQLDNPPCGLRRIGFEPLDVRILR